MDPYFDPYNNIPGYYHGNDWNFNGYQWNDQQQIPQNYLPSDTATNGNYHEDNFDQCQFDENYQYFDGNVEGSNRKRAREYYGDENNYAPNAAKRQKVNEPIIQYAMKKSSDYAKPMRKVLDLLFESDITADGWEKINNQIRYHITVRGATYSQWGSSIEMARESTAETALKQLAGFKLQKISWPPQLLPFRLGQPLADSIEMFVLIEDFC